MSDQIKTKACDVLVEVVIKKLLRPHRLSANDFTKRKLETLSTGKGVNVCVVGTGTSDSASLLKVVGGVSLGETESIVDTEGHSTISSSIIGANDPANVMGIAPDCSLCCAKVTDEDGQISEHTLSAAIIWGVVMDAHIIVFPQIHIPSTPAVLSALEKAANSGILIIAAKASGINGILTPEKLRFKNKKIYTAYLNQNFAEVLSIAFKPAILAGVAALLIEGMEEMNPSLIIEKVRHLFSN